MVRKLVAEREDAGIKRDYLSYLEERESGYGFNHESVTYCFYILSENEVIFIAASTTS